MTDQPSYLLAPRSGPTPRDGKIQLGNIFDHPLKVYDFPISRPNTALRKTVSPSHDLPSMTVNKSSTWGAELWARFLYTFQATVDAGRSKTFSMKYSDVRAAHTEEFDPGDETIHKYIDRRIREEPDLQKRLDKTNIFSRPVYMVVGIQYALTMTYEIARHEGGQGRLGAGGHLAQNVNAGAAAGATGDHGFYLKDTVRGESIFAYQMLEIRPKGFRRARPPAAVWVTEAALSDAHAGDDEDDSDEDDNAQDGNLNPAVEDPVGAVDVESSLFQEEHVVTIE